MSAPVDLTALPSRVDGVRRQRRLSVDDWSSTWTGWQVETGRPARLRLIHPHRRDDPALRARVAAIAAVGRALSPTPPTAHLDGAWPHLRLLPTGPSLATALPLEEPTDPLLSAGCLGAAVGMLEALEAAGRAPSGPLRAWVFMDGAGWSWGWLGPGPRAEAPGAALARLARDLDPDGLDPICALPREWTTDPPPDARGARLLFQRQLHEHLGAAARGLAARAERRPDDHRRLRVLDAVSRLGRALPPPRARLTLAQPGPREPLQVESDGVRVTAGPRAARLVLYAPRTGLVPATTRLVLRAWSRQDAAAPEGAALMRWLRAQSRLRVSRLLLERQVARALQPENTTRSR